MALSGTPAPFANTTRERERRERPIRAAEIAALEESQADDAAPSPDPPPGDLLSPRDAAAQYGVPTRTITRMIETGAPVLGSHKRVSAAEVAALARLMRRRGDGLTHPAGPDRASHKVENLAHVGASGGSRSSSGRSRAA